MYYPAFRGQIPSLLIEGAMISSVHPEVPAGHPLHPPCAPSLGARWPATLSKRPAVPMSTLVRWCRPGVTLKHAPVVAATRRFTQHPDGEAGAREGDQRGHGPVGAGPRHPVYGRHDDGERGAHSSKSAMGSTCPMASVSRRSVPCGRLVAERTQLDQKRLRTSARDATDEKYARS